MDGTRGGETGSGGGGGGGTGGQVGVWVKGEGGGHAGSTGGGHHLLLPLLEGQAQPREVPLPGLQKVSQGNLFPLPLCLLGRDEHIQLVHKLHHITVTGSKQRPGQAGRQIVAKDSICIQ